MTNHNQLKNHLKNFTVKELKKEVVNVKRGFQVSKLKRVDVENVILKNHLLFQHLLEKNKVKKIKPSVKKPKPSEKKQQNHNPVKQYIIQLLNNLDERAAGKRYPEYIDERNSGVTIQKSKTRYIIRNTYDFGDVLLSTIDRNQVEDFLYHILK